MIDVIVYANRADGFDLYDRTKGFPDEYAKDIAAVCGRFGARGSERTCSFRYAPLRDRYLFSVILSGISHSEESRVHYEAVNFLMTKDDADKLFRARFSVTLERLVRFAELVLDPSDELQLPSGPIQTEVFTDAQDAPAPRKKVTDSGMYQAMLAGAVCAAAGVGEGKQVFAATEDAAAQLDILISNMPLPLRKTLSFVAGAQSAADSEGVSLCLCSARRLSAIKQDGFAGGPATHKMIYMDGAFTNIEPQLSGYAQTLAGLSVKEHKLAMQLLGGSEDWGLYLQIADCLGGAPADTEGLLAIIGAAGDDTFACLASEGQLPSAWVSVLTKNLKALRAYPATCAVFEKKGGKGAKRFDTAEIAVSMKDPEKKKTLARVLYAVLSAVLPAVLAAFVLFTLKKDLVTAVDEFGVAHITLSVGTVSYALNMIFTAVLAALAGYFVGRVKNIFKD